MTTSLVWKIEQLERTIENGCVFRVSWSLKAIENDYIGYTFGMVNLEPPDELIPFEDLTEEIVLSWVKDQLGEDRVQELETYVCDEVARQKEPVVANGLPW